MPLFLAYGTSFAKRIFPPKRLKIICFSGFPKTRITPPAVASASTIPSEFTYA